MKLKSLLKDALLIFPVSLFGPWIALIIAHRAARKRQRGANAVPPL